MTRVGGDGAGTGDGTILVTIILGSLMVIVATVLVIGIKVIVMTVLMIDITLPSCNFWP